MNQHTSPNTTRQVGLPKHKRKQGTPHPTIPGLILIKYRKGRATPEQWGTPEQLQKLKDKQTQTRIIRDKKPKTIKHRRKTAKAWRTKNPKKQKAYARKAYEKRKAEGYYEKLKSDPEHIKRRRKNARNCREKKKANDPEGLKREMHEGYKRRVESGANARDRALPKNRLADALRARVNRVIKKPTGNYTVRTLELLGCTIQEFMKHLSQHFYNHLETNEPMSFDNYGMFGWHVDHTIPVSSFDLTDPKQQEQCFNYTNLKPMWCHENWSKRDKLPKAA